MNFEQWGILAEIVASLATVGALVALTLEMRKSRQIENRQIIFESVEKWEKMLDQRNLVKAMFWENYEDFREKYVFGDQESDAAFVSQLNFFEMLFELTHHGLIEKHIIVQWWGLVAVHNWELMKEILLSTRKEGYAEYGIHMEWFVNEVLKAYPEYAVTAKKANEERIARLREERA